MFACLAEAHIINGGIFQLSFSEVPADISQTSVDTRNGGRDRRIIGALGFIRVFLPLSPSWTHKHRVDSCSCKLTTARGLFFNRQQHPHLCERPVTSCTTPWPTFLPKDHLASSVMLDWIMTWSAWDKYQNSMSRRHDINRSFSTMNSSLSSY